MARLNHVSALKPGFDGYLSRSVHRSMSVAEAEAADLTTVDDVGTELEGSHYGLDTAPAIEAEWRLVVAERGRFLEIGETVMAVSRSGDHAINITDEPPYDELIDLTGDQVALDGLGMHIVPEREIAQSMGRMSSTGAGVYL